MNLYVMILGGQMLASCTCRLSCRLERCEALPYELFGFSEFAGEIDQGGLGAKNMTRVIDTLLSKQSSERVLTSTTRHKADCMVVVLLI